MIAWQALREVLEELGLADEVPAIQKALCARGTSDVPPPSADTLPCSASPRVEPFTPYPVEVLQLPPLPDLDFEG